MNKARVNSAICLAVISLSACGGSSTTPVTFAELQQDFTADVTTYGVTNGVGLPSTAAPLSDVPTSGNPTYTGPIAVIARTTGNASDITLTPVTIAAEGMMGEMTVTANFAPTGGAISGIADNFKRADGTAVGGDLTFSTGLNRNSISGSNPSGSVTTSVPSTFTGTLTNTPIGTAKLDGAFFGAFASPEAAFVGTAFANANAVNGTAAFQSTFIAKQ